MLRSYFATLAENGETPSTELLGMMQAFAPNVMIADMLMGVGRREWDLIGRERKLL